MWCKFLLFFIIVQEIVLFFFNQLKFFNKKMLISCISFTNYYKLKAVCISKSK